MLAHVASLIKPRIVALLCVTGLSAALAAGGYDPLTLGSFLLAGGAIAAGSAALNCYYDRDLDRHMERTADRPLPRGDLSPTTALAVALGLLAVGTLIGLATLPALSVAFMWLGVAAYVGLYTVGLKRRHPAGVVLGGSAGSFPVLAGWSAVAPLSAPTDLATAAPWLMAALVFVWTPAHAWALAVVYRDDFAAAEIPTLPVVASEARVARAVWRFALASVALAAVVALAAGTVYAAAVLVATPFFLAAYHRYRRERTDAAAVAAFFASNTFLAAVFAGWAASGHVGGPAATLTVAAGTVCPFALVAALEPSLSGVAAARNPLLVRARALLGREGPPDPAAGPDPEEPAAGPDPEEPAAGPLRPDGGPPEEGGGPP